MKMRIDVLKGRGNRERREWHIQDARLTGIALEYPNTLISYDSNLVLPVHETTMSLGIGSHYELTDMKYTPNLPQIARRCSDPLFFFIYNTDNYFHFLYDTLPFLLDFLRLRASFPRMKLLMSPGRKYPFVYDCLALLGITQDDIVFADTQTLYTDLYVVNSYTHDGQPNDSPHPDIWKVYAHMKRPCSIETPKKIYISRRSWIHGDTSNIGTNYTLRRRMECEDELVETLAHKGYVEVFCETMSMSEKIHLFSNATHVVGAIGGGMCNLVFARPECRVYSLNSPYFDSINQRFLHTMQHTNLTQYRDTWTVSKLYRRVRVGDRIGEITDENGDMLTIQIGTSAGWNATASYETYRVPEPSVTYLDNGLNSPWSFNVIDFITNIE